MARSRRLFELVNLLRGRRVAITAQALAEQLEVSERTIYRDIAALQASGVAVDGEAGVGYRLRPGSHLPPLMFDGDEVLALVLGLKMVIAQTDPELAEAAGLAERRIRAVLSDGLKKAVDDLPYQVPITTRSRASGAQHAVIRQAAIGRRKLRIGYADEQGMATERVVWPLAILNWGDRWTVLGWCELRQDYRNFRIDRIAALDLLDDGFVTSPTLSYEHYIRSQWMDDSGA